MYILCNTGNSILKVDCLKHFIFYIKIKVNQHFEHNSDILYRDNAANQFTIFVRLYIYGWHLYE